MSEVKISAEKLVEWQERVDGGRSFGCSAGEMRELIRLARLGELYESRPEAKEVIHYAKLAEWAETMGVKALEHIAGIPEIRDCCRVAFGKMAESDHDFQIARDALAALPKNE